MYRPCVPGQTDLDPEIGRGGADESERCPYVYLDDDVPSVVRRGMQHAVVREARVVHDVVELPEFPGRVISRSTQSVR